MELLCGVDSKSCVILSVCKTLLTLWTFLFRKRGNGLKLHQGRFKLNIRIDFFTGRVVKHLDRLPEEVVDSTFLEVLKK